MGHFSISLLSPSVFLHELPLHVVFSPFPWNWSFPGFAVLLSDLRKSVSCCLCDKKSFKVCCLSLVFYGGFALLVFVILCCLISLLTLFLQVLYLHWDDLPSLKMASIQRTDPWFLLILLWFQPSDVNLCSI